MLFVYSDIGVVMKEAMLHSTIVLKLVLKFLELYNIYKNKLIKFQPDSVEGWHAYEVANPAKEVPIDVLRQMLKDGKITNSQYKG